MLKLENVHVSYSNLEVLHGINLEVNDGEIVCIIGANGAGKTTTLKTVAGLLPMQKGGSIQLDGKTISSMSAEKIVAGGVALSPEGRHVFPDLTVQDNLEMGAYLRRRDKKGIQRDFAEIFRMFPRLEERKKQLARTLSGGEQQILAIARALMSQPKLLMLDEPSTGLAPLIVKEIFSIVKKLNQEKGLTILLVEQNAKIALAAADRGYVLKNGKIVLSDTGENLLKNESVRAAYLGENLSQNK